MVVIRTDADGHRIPAARALNPDAVRLDAAPIVFAGDSYVFGNEVNAEETFVYLVEESLSSRRVVNIGVGGYFLSQTCRALQRYITQRGEVGRAFLVIYIGNDIEHGAYPPELTRVDRYGYLRTSTERGMWIANVRSFAVRHSRLMFYLGAAWHVLSAASTDTASDPSDTGARWIYDRHAFTRDRLDPHGHVLAELRDHARSRGVPVTVVLMPEKGQVYGSLSDLPNQMLLSMIDDLGMPVIDLLPAMRGVAAERPHLWNDGVQGHLSPEGHRFVADILIDHLTRAASESIEARALDLSGTTVDAENPSTTASNVGL
jgi:hypothetical protein